MWKPRLIFALLLAFTLTLGPGWARAAERERLSDITITRNGEFDRAHGVRSGHGTVRDPFVISGWDVHHISISDTSRAVRIVSNTVAGQLTLNWIGSNVVVERNDIGDLRVNENVPRFGAPTSGVIRNNTFGLVGQLRHFDGRFVYNTVGSSSSTTVPFFGSGPAVTFDGFNGALFAHNTIYGPVDARLHGHHHSSAYGQPSHMHAGTTDDHGMVDHTQRFHSVVIEANHIITAPDAQYGLAYLDTNHAGNDRTAPSETNPDLNAPHVHHTRVHIMDNVLDGAGILVDVFNAPDELHPTLAWGEMHITGNRISLQRGSFWPFQSRYGIDVEDARGVALTIARNVVVSPPATHDVDWLRSWEISGAGIFLDRIDQARVAVTGDAVSNLQYGVQATEMTKSVRWAITGLRTSGVEQPVGYDSTVANKPVQR